MSSPLNAILNGTFTADSNGDQVTLSLPSGATEFEIFDLAGWGSSTSQIMTAKGYAALPAGSALTGTTSAGEALTYATVSTGGFTFFQDSANQPVGAPIVNAAGGITKANGAVLTSGTLYPVGSVIRVYNTTAMLQIAGMDFSVTASGAGTMTLGYLNSSAFANAATANSLINMPFAAVALSSGAIAPDPRFYPRRRYITAITQATNAVVTMSVAHAFTVGEKVRIIVPAAFGMTQLNNYLATITAVNYTTNTITLDTSTVGYTAFAFPTSAVAAAGVTFAQVVPVGEAAVNTSALPVANLLNDRTRNVSVNGVVIGSAMLVATHTYGWIAKNGLTVTS
jgi:hypothetical protein